MLPSSRRHHARPAPASRPARPPRWKRQFTHAIRRAVRPSLPQPKLTGGLTVLIPAYNEAACIADTIRSVRQQSSPAQRIIVIDDCSRDGTGEIARRMGVEVLRPPQNCGSKASALNFALTSVQTEFVLAIDADTTLAPDAIEKLMGCFDSEKTACVCGMVIPRRVSTLWERGRYVEYLYAFSFYKPIQDYYQRPLIASGCFSAYRTSVLRELHGWSMRTVGEDMDLTWSIYARGLVVRFAQEAVCYPIEPHNFHFLDKQLKRWSHGFAQCVRVHWKNGLEIPYLRSMVAVALWDALAAILGLFVVIPILAIVVHPIFLLGYALDLPSVAVPVFIAAARRGEVGRAFASLPGFLVLRITNSVYVLRAFWAEFVSGRSLRVFEKGH